MTPSNFSAVSPEYLRNRIASSVPRSCARSRNRGPSLLCQVIANGVIGFDELVVDDFAFDVDDRDARKLRSFVRQALQVMLSDRPLGDWRLRKNACAYHLAIDTEYSFRGIRSLGEVRCFDPPVGALPIFKREGRVRIGRECVRECRRGRVSLVGHLLAVEKVHRRVGSFELLTACVPVLGQSLLLLHRGHVL